MVADGPALIQAVFPNYDGEQAWFDPSEITVVFQAEQTPTDLGPLVRVELINETSQNQ